MAYLITCSGIVRKIIYYSHHLIYVFAFLFVWDVCLCVAVIVIKSRQTDHLSLISWKTRTAAAAAAHHITLQCKSHEALSFSETWRRLRFNVCICVRYADVWNAEKRINDWRKFQQLVLLCSRVRDLIYYVGPGNALFPKLFADIILLNIQIILWHIPFCPRDIRDSAYSRHALLNISQCRQSEWVKREADSEQEGSNHIILLLCFYAIVKQTNKLGTNRPTYKKDIMRNHIHISMVELSYVRSLQHTSFVKCLWIFLWDWLKCEWSHIALHWASERIAFIISLVFGCFLLCFNYAVSTKISVCVREMQNRALTRI